MEVECPKCDLPLGGQTTKECARCKVVFHMRSRCFPTRAALTPIGKVWLCYDCREKASTFKG